MPRLSIFAAYPTGLIVRRANRGKDWQLIRWDMSTDTFHEGQWILNKHLWIDGCSLSSDGILFYWIYNTYCMLGETHAGISNVPYFTAIMYGDKGFGRWDQCRFDKVTKKPINNQGLEFTSVDRMIECVDKGVPESTGLIKEREWVDPIGRTITIHGYQVFADNELIYDATENVFVPITYPTR